MTTTLHPSALELVIRRDRLVVLVGLIAIAGLAWAYMIYLAQDMRSMMIPLDKAWGISDFTFQYTMWAIMMVAMMTPSASPMILTFATLQRRRRERMQPYVPTSAFVTGYLIGWASFAAAATLAQWGLHHAALLSPMMESSNALLGGTLLLGAALFQLTPVKHACLKSCQSPFSFIMNYWRDGAGGALRMGLRHGAYCVGCCWALMALLFVTGVMSVAWVAVIAVFVLVEKIAPQVRWLAFVSIPVLLTLSGLTFAGVIN